MLKVEPCAEKAKILHMYYLLLQRLLDPAEIYTFGNITFFTLNPPELHIYCLSSESIGSL